MQESLSAGPRILIINDDRSLIESRRLLLENCGARVFTARGTAEAVRETVLDPVDLVLIDASNVGVGHGERLCHLVKHLRPAETVALLVLPNTAIPPGQPSAGVYLIDRGRIALIWTGDRVVRRVDTVRPGEILGVAAALDGTHEVTARAAFDTEYRFVPRERLLSVLSQDSALQHYLVSLAAQEKTPLDHFVARNASRI